MKQNHVTEFEDKLQLLKNAGCEGVAFFATDTRDASIEDLAEQGTEHANAILTAVASAEYRDATRLSL